MSAGMSYQVRQCRSACRTTSVSIGRHVMSIRQCRRLFFIRYVSVDRHVVPVLISRQVVQRLPGLISLSFPRKYTYTRRSRHIDYKAQGRHLLKFNFNNKSILFYNHKSFVFTVNNRLRCMTQRI